MIRSHAVRTMLLTTILACSASSLVAQLITSQITLNTGALRAVDVAVTGPGLPQGVLSGPVNATWKITNTGSMASPDTSLRLDCKAVYLDKPISGCLFGTESVAVPPLSVGASYSVSRKMFYVSSSIDPNKGTQYLYRFQLDATLDPLNAIPESNEINNKIAWFAENFTGAPPPQVVAVSSTTAQPTTSTASATTTVLGVRPTLEIYSQTNPWKPEQATWIVVKNKGPGDSPAVKLGLSCTALQFDTSSWSTKETYCDFFFPQPYVDIPPLKAGEFKAAGQFLIQKLKGDLGTWDICPTKAVFSLWPADVISNVLTLSTMKE